MLLKTELEVHPRSSEQKDKYLRASTSSSSKTPLGLKTKKLVSKLLLVKGTTQGMALFSSDGGIKRTPPNSWKENSNGHFNLQKKTNLMWEFHVGISFYCGWFLGHVCLLSLLFQDSRRCQGGRIANDMAMVASIDFDQMKEGEVWKRFSRLFFFFQGTRKQKSNQKIKFPARSMDGGRSGYTPL